MSETHPDLLDMVSQIISAYAGNNQIGNEALPVLIREVYGAIKACTVVEPEPPALSPAAPINRSVFPEYIVCLEDGRKLKMLKRHLMTRYDMTPDQYREKWGLPYDYPMVAPAYAQVRSDLAKASGLGRNPNEPVPAPPPKRRRK